jgi:glycosyltransferase involved in cell wall biosynthesis
VNGTAPGGHVRILLSTYNGAAYLPEQLASFRGQTHADWSLLWRDDGSEDATEALMAAFTAEIGADRCRRLEMPPRKLGVRESFLTLLRATAPTLGPRDAVAFADQDDVWLPEKLARGVAALTAIEPDVPALLCTRQMLVDAALAPFGESPVVHRPPGFPAALTQNVATGCTVLLNRAAARLVAGSRAPETTLHDWWSYLVVSAAGGRVLVDPAPLVLYRQHGANVVGAPATLPGRAIAALRRGPGKFMRIFRANLACLAAQPALLTDTARRDVTRLQAALSGGWLTRARALRTPGLRRQTRLGTLTFRLWFLLS